jgi:hypothetical protein
MKLIIEQIALLILFSVIISCNGQETTENRSPKIEEVLEVNQVTFSKNGFSTGYVDKDGTLWFSSNSGGVYHSDRKIVKNLYPGRWFE